MLSEKFDYSRPVLKKVFIALGVEEPKDEAAFLTIGGDIFYVQDEDYYREALIKDGYEIWGYINEEGYYPLARETELIHAICRYPSALCICTKKAAR